ncbi:DUF4054 domain-containing protein [Lichenihabitans psoromatis]|uniref:DUF4054 domain-containing protein n=1 Tax=Lichenihabitans psoromatis TaxID=2528642 RepID=UPI001036AA83|nr:DUF4054 domain-containing protein [Lichenihabitans psoromatis]
MSLTPPMAADLVSRFPAFATVPTVTLTARLAEASTRVDQTWTSGEDGLAILLYAAHLLTLDGFGGGAEASLAAAGALGFTSFRSGQFSLERRGSERTTQVSDLSETIYGRRFLALLRVNQPAVLVP